MFDDCIFAFFAVEMVIKMIALGIFGSKCYLGDTWNRLDFFIVMAGWGISLFPHLSLMHLTIITTVKLVKRDPPLDLQAIRWEIELLWDFPALWFIYHLKRHSPCCLKWPLNWQEWWMHEEFSFKTSFFHYPHVRSTERKVIEMDL